MRHRGLGSKMVGVAMALGAATAAYLLYIRHRQLRWGATDEELERSMPGDEIVEYPTFNATRAVTIGARPQEIWPWIVQIGVTRAGWYSYDPLDNLGRPSARRILPQFQNPKIGDVVPMSPDGKQGPLVKDFEEDRWMLWWDGKGGMSWVWGLYPVDEARTRLITRVRLHYDWRSASIFFHMLVEFTDILMMRKSMLGIKERAENGPGREPVAD